MSVTVRVRLDAAMSRRLPPVCVMTGAQAAGYAPVVARPHAWAAIVWFARTRQRRRSIVLLPMADEAFDQWMTLRSRRVWCAYLGIVGLVAAGVLRWAGPLSIVVLALAIVSLATAIAAHVREPWHQVSTSVDVSGRWLTLAGVHDRFADALRGQR
jgi:hypothetical protein